MTLDFSQFHPSDHWPFSKRCKKFYGGGWWHLKVAWQFHRKEQIEYHLKRPLYKLLLCRLGVHRTFCYHNGLTNQYLVSCWFCNFRRGARDDEIFPIPDFGSMKIIGLDEEEED